MSGQNRPVDDIDYVDDFLYQDVWDFVRTNAAWSGRGVVATGPLEVTPVLAREARLLDSRSYEEWLALYAARCVYWVPLHEAVGDPRIEPAIHFDDHRRLADRVALIRTGSLHAQTPPSRTCHVVTNVECRAAGEELVDLHSCLTVHEMRRGHSQLYVGRQYHRLERTAEGWKIKYRALLLVDRDVAQGNITFIL